MGAYITCPQKGGNLIDMECCRSCFYKRLDSDYSLMWCRFKMYQNKKENWLNNIKKAEAEIKKLKSYIEILYKTGKTHKAHRAEKDLNAAENKRAAAIELYKNSIKVIKIAIEVNKPDFTSIEEYLTSRDILARSRNLDNEKDVRDFADSIKEKR